MNSTMLALDYNIWGYNGKTQRGGHIPCISYSGALADDP
jgi:hypothetical protein